MSKISYSKKYTSLRNGLFIDLHTAINYYQYCRQYNKDHLDYAQTKMLTIKNIVNNADLLLEYYKWEDKNYPDK